MATLYVVATPIGNLSDASPRMVETFGSVSLIAAEDTRVTGNLLRHFGISKPMTSLHRHNEAGKASGIVARMLAEGIDVALATDAGTPGISDPGHLLAREAAEAGIAVIAVPGPSALAAALSVSGFDARAFAFYGFLPRERGDLGRRLLDIARGAPVAVLHESPHRVVALMEMVVQTLPGCLACVCCDLTKRFERTLRGDAETVLQQLRENPKVEKGEYCVVLDMHAVSLPPPHVAAAVSTEARLFMHLLAGRTVPEAIEALVAEGVRKNDAKRAALRCKQYMQAFAEEGTS